MDNSGRENQSHTDLTDTARHYPDRLTAWLNAVDTGDDTAAERLVDALGIRDAEALAEIYHAAHRADASDWAENRRWWCVQALTGLAGPAESAALIQMLEDPVAGLRAGGALCVADVIRRYWDSQQPSAERLLDKLILCLVDEATLVRQTAADALAQLGQIALPVLWQALQQKNQSGRTRAAYALRRMRHLDAAPYLYQLLEDPNPMVNLYAREGLDDLGLLDMAYYRP